jgi:hypothetical protein
MGSGSSQAGVVIRQLTVDCKDVGSCTGIQNVASQEGSRVEDVVINNASATGLYIGSGAANSGPYRNITIQYPSCATSCGASTYGVQVVGGTTGQLIRGLDNITVSGSGISPQTGIVVAGYSTRITNTHVEYFNTGIAVGGVLPALTRNVQIENVSILNTGGWDISLLNSARDIQLAGVSSASSNSHVLNDAFTGNSLNTTDDAFIGFYAMGHCPSSGCTGAQPTVFSSSNTVIWKHP